MKASPMFVYRDGFLTDGTGHREAVSAKETPPGSVALSPQEAAGFLQGLESDGINLLVAAVSWEQVEPEPERYNESFLADLRDFLKAAEARHIAAVVSFKMKNNANGADAPEDGEGQDAFIEAAAHTARRTKDCANILGFILPESGGEDFRLRFARRFEKKHPHFIFFKTPDGAAGSDPLFVDAPFLLKQP